MHIINKISSMLSLEPNRNPKLSFEFLPLPFDKYITIYNEFSIPSNNYDYFNDVIDDIKPYLDENNVHIIQILNSHNDKKLKNCFYLEKFSYQQLNFILKNSLLHVSTDAYTNEIAGMLGIKNILLIGNRFPVSSKSWYGNNNTVISKTIFNKPTFSINENPKSINQINSEDISSNILNKIEIKFSNFYKTVFIGSKYAEYPCCDFIPSSSFFDNKYSRFNLNIRLDKFFNESNCLDICQNNNHTIYTDKKLSAFFIKHIKQKCNKIIYYVDINSKVEDIIEIYNYGINIEILYKNNLFDKDIAFKFLDFGKINIEKSELQEDIRKKINNKQFKTSKIILFNNNIYASYAHLEKGIKMSTINKCIDSPLFWKDECRYKIIGDDNEQIKS